MLLIENGSATKGLILSILNINYLDKRILCTFYAALSSIQHHYDVTYSSFYIIYNIVVNQVYM